MRNVFNPSGIAIALLICASLLSCSGGGSSPSGTTPTATGNLTLVANPSNPLLGIVTNADGSKVSMFGLKDANGGPLSIQQAIVSLPGEDFPSSKVDFDAEGKPTAIHILTGGDILFDYTNPNAPILTIVSGAGGIAKSFSYDLSTGAVTPILNTSAAAVGSSHALASPAATPTRALAASPFMAAPVAPFSVTGRFTGAVVAQCSDGTPQTKAEVQGKWVPGFPTLGNGVDLSFNEQSAGRYSFDLAGSFGLVDPSKVKEGVKNVVKTLEIACLLKPTPAVRASIIAALLLIPPPVGEALAAAANLGLMTYDYLCKALPILKKAPVAAEGLSIVAEILLPNGGVTGVVRLRNGKSKGFSKDVNLEAGLPDILVQVDDSDCESSVSFVQSLYSVKESDVGPVAVQIVRQGYTLARSTVGYFVSGGTAVRDVDYTLADGIIEFGPGETIKILPLSILNNPQSTGDRTIDIQLFGGDFGVIASNATIGIPGSTTVKIFKGLRLAVTKTGSGAADGRIFSDPPGIDCGLRCLGETSTFSGTVTLQADTKPGARFVKWTGDCTGTAICVLDMNGPKTVSAEFEDIATLSISEVGAPTCSQQAVPDKFMFNQADVKTWTLRSTVTMTGKVGNYAGSCCFGNWFFGDSVFYALTCSDWSGCIRRASDPSETRVAVDRTMYSSASWREITGTSPPSTLSFFISHTTTPGQFSLEKVISVDCG